VWVDEHGRTTLPGLYAAGDMGSVPHNYMLGAFVNGAIAGQDAAAYAAENDLPALDEAAVARERERVLAPTRRDDGITPHEMEYKTRRMVNDYLQPPKVTRKMEIGLQRFAEIRDDLDHLVARDPHELMRALEVQSILDCAEMAATASLYRTESRWGLYHYRVDYPETDDENWFCHTQLYKDADGRMACKKRPVAPYVVPLEETERNAYHRLRIKTPASAAE
jgi:succinate dehydrogenase/fumarate reductase flavoprotein subunit